MKNTEQNQERKLSTKDNKKTILFALGIPIGILLVWVLWKLVLWPYVITTNIKACTMFTDPTVMKQVDTNLRDKCLKNYPNGVRIYRSKLK